METNSHFTLVLESTRDILLFPAIHTCNEDFVRKESTWEAISKVEKLTSSDPVRFPWSAWKLRFPSNRSTSILVAGPPAMTKYKLRKNAHAHVHLLLTPIAISMLSRDAIQRVYPPREIPLYVLNLTGCHRDPVDYEYDDAITLQSSRILSYHIIETEKNISQIKDSVKLLEKNTMKEESMKIIMREMLTEFLERKQSEPSSPLILSNDPNQSTSSNAISNDGKNDSASEGAVGTNLYPETPSAPSNIRLRGYCYFFITVIILIFAIVYYQYRQGRLFAFLSFRTFDS